MEDPNINRLLESHTEAIEETNKQIEKLEISKKEYQSLAKLLEDIPLKVAQKAILPFGKKALVAGKFIHTNEIHVYNGCDYFSLQSAHEAKGVVTHRVKKLDGNIDNLKRQKSLQTTRLECTRRIHSEEVETFPIREEYDPVAEAEWDRRHREILRSKKKPPVDENPQLSDEALLERMEEYAREEAAQERPRKSSLKQSSSRDSITPPSGAKDKKVKFSMASECPASSSSEVSSELTGSSEEDEVSIPTRVIRFHHSQCLPSTSGVASGDLPPALLTPADVTSLVNPAKSETVQKTKTVERPVEVIAPAANVPGVQSDPPRPMSRFKAMRLGLTKE